MQNLKIWLNEKKNPTKIEFCCDDMAVAMCRTQAVRYYQCDLRDERNPSTWIPHYKITMQDDFCGLSCCPFCKGDIEFIKVLKGPNE